jgi:hypothetical protein
MRTGAPTASGQPKRLTAPLNDLLTTHTAPELEFLLAKWAAYLSFSTVAELLQDVLPVDTGLHQETVRQHVMATADRLEAQLAQEQFMYDGGDTVRVAGRPPLLVLKKLSRALEEFGTYIDNNVGAIVNYGERRRCGERISTGFVESTINQLIAKRFVRNTHRDR